MDIIPTPKKNVILDATLLSLLMSCPRLMDLSINHRFVSTRGKSNSLEVGSLIHKVLEVYYDHIIKGFPRATAIGNSLAAGHLYVAGCQHCAHFSDIGENARPTCGHSPEEYPGLLNTPEFSVKWDVGWRFALETCEKYFEVYKNDSFIPLAAEVVKGEVLYEDDEIRVLWKAKLDLLIDTTEVGIVSMDHKTFKQKREKTSLSNQFLGQCALLKTRQVIKNGIGLQTTLKIEERLGREMISYSADRLNEWQNEILPYYAYKLIQYQESEHYPPNFTHCDTMYGPCKFKRVCESNRNMREEVLRTEFMIGPIWDPTNKQED